MLRCVAAAPRCDARTSHGNTRDRGQRTERTERTEDDHHDHPFSFFFFFFGFFFVLEDDGGIFWSMNRPSWYIRACIRASVHSFRFVDTLRHASSTHIHDMSDERTYIMIKYVSDDDDEDDVFTRLSLSLSL